MTSPGPKYFVDLGEFGYHDMDLSNTLRLRSSGKGSNVGTVIFPILAVGFVALVVTIIRWLPQAGHSPDDRRADGPGIAAGGALRANPVVQPVAQNTPSKAPHDVSSTNQSGEKTTEGATETPAPLVTETTSLGLAGISGDSVHGLLSFKSGGPVDQLEFYCSPLKAEGDAPPQPAPTATADLASKDQHDVLLNFTLPTLPAGKYTSRLFVRYKATSATSASVPLTLTVKHNWPWPLTFLLVGVVAGAIVSNYRMFGRPRDEAYQRLGRLKSEIASDVKLAVEFRNYIEQDFLAEAEMYVRNGQWEQAGPRLEEAERVWVRWLRYRDEWIELLDCLSGYEQEVAKMSTRRARPAPAATRLTIFDTRSSPWKLPSH